jgi:two-component system sensor histidine kinase UhpB
MLRDAVAASAPSPAASVHPAPAASPSPPTGIAPRDPDSRPVRSDGSRPVAEPSPVIVADDNRTVDEVIHDLMSAHELERRRIARDVHDIVGQALTAVRIHLELIRQAGELGAASIEARRALTTVDRALSEVRDLAFEIRPQILDDLGLVAAARWLVTRQGRAVGYRPTFIGDGVRRGLGVEIEAACFRTLQEALTNVARHARARRVRVVLAQTDRELSLTIQDDGVGFDPRRLRGGRQRRPSLGLLGISEGVALVGGSLEVTSRVGAGTTVRARFPTVTEDPSW